MNTTNNKQQGFVILPILIIAGAVLISGLIINKSKNEKTENQKASIVGPKISPTPVSESLVLYTKSVANVRECPSQSCRVLFTLPAANATQFPANFNTSQEWYLVTFYAETNEYGNFKPNSKDVIGYVHSSLYSRNIPTNTPITQDLLHKTKILTPTPSTSTHLLDDKDTVSFYNGQIQAIDIENNIIQRHQTQIYQSQSWITNVKAVLPYQYDYIIEITTPIILDGQNLIVLLRSSINNHKELIQIRKIIITALENDDSQTLLNIKDKLSQQTEITIETDKQINQLIEKLDIETQNLTKILAGQNNSSTPIYVPNPIPIYIPIPTTTTGQQGSQGQSVPLNLPPPEPEICQQIRDDPDFSKSLKQTRLNYYGCYY